MTSVGFRRQSAPMTCTRGGAPLLPRRVAFPHLTLTSVPRYGTMVELRYDVPS